VVTDPHTNHARSPARPPLANTQTGPITIHCAAKLSAQCNNNNNSSNAGAVVTELAASRKEVKYAGLDGRMFASTAFENLGVPSASTRQLLSNLGRKLIDISGESRKTSYLFQRCSVLEQVQRFNAVLLHDSLPDRDCTDY